MPPTASSRSTAFATSCSRSSLAWLRAALRAARLGRSPWTRSFATSPRSSRPPTAGLTTTRATW
eukprot:1290098-Pyramimonas_sp.AAC.1